MEERDRVRLQRSVAASAANVDDNQTGLQPFSWNGHLDHRTRGLAIESDRRRRQRSRAVLQALLRDLDVNAPELGRRLERELVGGRNAASASKPSGKDHAVLGWTGAAIA